MDVTLSALAVICLLAPGAFAEKSSNHNYDSSREWIQKAFYEKYEEDVKNNQTLRILKYFNSGVPNESNMRITSSDINKTEIITPAEGKSLDIETLESTHGPGNQTELRRKTDLETDPLLIGQISHEAEAPQLYNSPDGKVEMEVFRGPNLRYVDVHGRTRHYARWGYFITQPINPDYNVNHLTDFYFTK